MSTTDMVPVDVPGGVQTLKAKEALEDFRDDFFSIEEKLWTLDSFKKEVAKNLGLDPNEVGYPKLEDAFIDHYRNDYFDGNIGLMKSVIRFAFDESALSLVSWLSIKDTVSPALANNKMFDGLLNRAQGSIGYDHYFGGLGSLTTDKDRTIFSPSAYLIDLLRMMDLYFDPEFMKDLRSNRRPDIFTLPLSPSNARDTLPLIDIINENLEMLLLSEWNKRRKDKEEEDKEREDDDKEVVFSIDRLLAEAKFPFNLPHHKGLSDIRANLSLEKGPDITYAELIHQVQEDFRGHSEESKYHETDRRVEELLELSPEEAKYIQNSATSNEEIASFYGFDRDEVNNVLKELSNVQKFIGRTGLSREELKLMIEGELSSDQLAAGESRNFFINDVQDGKQPLFMQTKTKLENLVVKLDVEVGDQTLTQLKYIDFVPTGDDGIIERFVSLKLLFYGKGRKPQEVHAKIGYSKFDVTDSKIGVTVGTLKQHIKKYIFLEDTSSDVKLMFRHEEGILTDKTPMSSVVDDWLKAKTKFENLVVELDVELDVKLGDQTLTQLESIDFVPTDDDPDDDPDPDAVIIDRTVSLRLSFGGKVGEVQQVVLAKIGYSKFDVTVGTLKKYIKKQIFPQDENNVLSTAKLTLKFRNGDNLADETALSTVVDEWLKELPGKEHNLDKEKIPEQNDYAELDDAIVNLSWEKLDRIHRFIRLWRKAKMTFKQLDWMVAPRQQDSSRDRKEGLGDTVMEYCPYFDGINDVISIALPVKIQLPLTIEFWVKPMVGGHMQIMDVKDCWAIGLDDDGKLVFGSSSGKDRHTFDNYALPLNRFSHVALVITSTKNDDDITRTKNDVNTTKVEITGFMNGRKDDSHFADLTLAGAQVQKILIGERFKGCFQELRIWDVARNSKEIRSTMNTRLTFKKFQGEGSDKKENLMHCWPLNTSYGGDVWDTTGSADGKLGDGIHARCPRWIVSDAPLDARDVPGMYFSGDIELLSGEGLPIHDDKGENFFIEVLLTLTDAVSDGIIFLDETEDSSSSIKLSVTGLELKFDVNDIASNKLDLEVEKMYNLRAEIKAGKATLKDLSEISSTSFVRVPSINGTESGSKGTVKIGKGFHGVIHRLKVGRLTSVNNSKTDDIADLADWTMTNTSSEETSHRIIVKDASGNDRIVNDRKVNRTIEGGKLRRKQILTPKFCKGIGSSVAFGMDGKSVIEITNKDNFGLARFPPFTFGIWFSPGETINSNEKEVIFAQGDDDVGLLCYVWNGELRVTWWTHQSDTNKHQSQVLATANLNSTSWHHLGVAFQPPRPKNGQKVEKNPPSEVLTEWQITVFLDGAPIDRRADAPPVELSPTESIYLGGVRDVEGRKVVVHNDNDDGTCVICHKDLDSLNFRGKLADFRIWAGCLTAGEIQTARAVSSIYQRVENGPKTLLVVPLDRESVVFSALKQEDVGNETTVADANAGPARNTTGEEETTHDHAVQQDGVPLAVREDTATFEMSGISHFKAALFRKKTVLSTVSAASTFAFSKQILDLTGDYKVTGRIRLTNSKGRIAIIVAGIAFTWDAKKARFCITGSDNLSGWNDMAAEVCKPSKKDLKIAMTETCPKWFRFAIQVEDNDPNITTSSATIRACAWFQGEKEPGLKTIDFVSSSPSEEQLSMGTLGVWTYGKGTKQIDDLAVYANNSHINMQLQLEESSELIDDPNMKTITSPAVNLLLDEGFEEGPHEFDKNWGVKQNFINANNVLDIQPNDENNFFEGIATDPNTVRLIRPMEKMWPTTMRANSCYTVSGLMWIPEGTQKDMGVAFYIGQNSVVVGARNGDDERTSLSFYTFGWSGSRQQFELVRNSSVLGFNQNTLERKYTIGETFGWHKFEVMVIEGLNRSTQIEATVWKWTTTPSFSQEKLCKLSTNDKGLDRLISGGVGFYSTDERARFCDVDVLNDQDRNFWKGALGQTFQNIFPKTAVASQNCIESATANLLFGFNEGNSGDSMRLEGEFLIKDDAGSTGFLLKVGEKSNYIGVEIGTSKGKGVREITRLTKKKSKLLFEHRKVQQKTEIEAGRLYNFVAEVIPSNFVSCLSPEGNLVTQYAHNLKWPTFWQSGKVEGRHWHLGHHRQQKVSRLVVDRRTKQPRLVIFQGTEDHFGDLIWSEDIRMPSQSLPLSTGFDILLTSSGGRKLGVGETVISVSNSIDPSEESIKFLLRQTNSGKLILKVGSSPDIIWESSGQCCFDDDFISKCNQADVSTLRVKVCPSSEIDTGLMEETYIFLFRHNRRETRRFGILSNGAAGNEFRNLRCRDVFRVLDHGDKGVINWEQSDIELSSEISTAMKLVHTHDDWEQALVTDVSSRIENDNAVGFDFIPDKYLIAKPYASAKMAKVDEKNDSKNLGWTWQARVSTQDSNESITLLTLESEEPGTNGETKKVTLDVAKRSDAGMDSIICSFNGGSPVVMGSFKNALLTVKSHLCSDQKTEIVSVFLNGKDLCLQCKVCKTIALYTAKQSLEVSGSIGHMILFDCPLPERDIGELHNFTLNEIVSKYSESSKSLLGGDVFTVEGVEQKCQLWPALPLLAVNSFTIGGTEKKFHPSPVVERLPESFTPRSSLWKRSSSVFTFPQKSFSVDSGFKLVADRRRTIEIWFTANDANRPGKQMLMTEDNQEGLVGETSSFELAIEGGYIHFGPNLRARVFSGHWYHMALVLNSSREERLGAYAAYLNGLLVGTAPGKMSSPPEKLYVGGSSFDGKIIAVNASNEAKSADDLGTSGVQPDLSSMSLSVESQTTKWLGREAAVTTSPLRASSGVIHSEILQKVATIRWLDDRDKISANEGVFLFGPISSDEVVRVFNNGVADAERWDPLEISIPWRPNEKTIASYSVRLLLAASLKVSSQGLDDLLVALGIDLDQQLTVDGAFLFRLLRFSKFVGLLGVSGKDLTALLRATTGSSELPCNPGDLIFLTRILDWLVEGRGVPPQLLSEFFDDPVSDSSVVKFATFVTQKSIVSSYTLNETSFVNGQMVNEDISKSVYGGISSFANDNDDGTSTVISRLRAFNAKDLRADAKWKTIFRSGKTGGLLDSFAEVDLAKKLNESETFNRKSTIRAEDAIQALIDIGFLFGPEMNSKQIVNLESLSSMSSAENIWDTLVSDPTQKQIWNKILPKWIRFWAGVKEHIEMVLLDHRRALDDAFSGGIVEVFGEEAESSKTINLDINDEAPLITALRKILSKEVPSTELEMRISRLRKESGTLALIGDLTDSVIAQKESFTLVEDSFISTNIDEIMSAAIFSTIYPGENSLVGSFLDGRTRTVVPRLRGITADAIRADTDWRRVFRPDKTLKELLDEEGLLKEYSESIPLLRTFETDKLQTDQWQELLQSENKLEGLLDKYARSDLATEVEKSSKVPKSAQGNLADDVMNLLVEDEDGLLFGPSTSSTQFFDVTKFRDIVDPDSVYKQFWNILLPKWLRKWAEVKEQIEIVFTDFRRALDDALSAGIAEVFELDDESAQAINLDTDKKTPLVRELRSIASENKEASTDLKTRIAKIDNVANLANAVGLDLQEVILLWKTPEAFEVRDLTRITFNDLLRIAKYTEIRDLLLELEEEDKVGAGTDPIEDLLNWLENLKDHRTQALNGIGLDVREVRKDGNFNISQFWRASRLVKLMRKTGATLELVLELGELEGFNNNDYERWNSLASSLGESVSFVTRDAKNIKEKLFEATQVQLRDAQLGAVSHRYRNELDNVTVVDTSLSISNFLLFEVLTGPKVLVSRVQQAIASIQFLIHRCLMGSEDNTVLVGGSDPIETPFMSAGQKDDVLDHWERWMKNYRVWEATRKVFLYPENFLDPDLRKNKTQLFENFESLAGDGTDPEQAITKYIEDFQALSTLRIIGSTFKATNASKGEDSMHKLALIGMKDKEIYVRERLQSGTTPLWRPWEKLDVAIAASFISPVYAFGRLHLFWTKEDTTLEEMYIFTKKEIDDFNTTKGSKVINEPGDVYLLPGDQWKDFNEALTEGFTVSNPILKESFDPSNPLAVIQNKNFFFISRKSVDDMLEVDKDEEKEKEKKVFQNFVNTIIVPDAKEMFNSKSRLFKKKIRDLFQKAKTDRRSLPEHLRGSYYEFWFHYFTTLSYNKVEKWIDDDMDAAFKSSYDDWENGLEQEIKVFLKKGRASMTGEVIKLNIQHQTRSPDRSWSLPKDIKTEEATFFYSDRYLPDGEEFSAEHRRPEHHIPRLLSGRMIPGEANVNTIPKYEKNGTPRVLDVTASGSKGITFKEITSSTSTILWETLVLVQKKNPVSEIENIEYEPQRVSLYELKSGEWTVNVKSEQIFSITNELLKSAKDAKSIFDFIRLRRKNDLQTSVHDIIAHLGPSNLVTDHFLPASIQRTLNLAGQKIDEAVEDFEERMRVVLPEKVETDGEFEQRRKKAINAIQSTAIAAITMDEWRTVSTFIEDRSNNWLKQNSAKDANSIEVFVQSQGQSDVDQTTIADIIAHLGPSNLVTDHFLPTSIKKTLDLAGEMKFDEKDEAFYKRMRVVLPEKEFEEYRMNVINAIQSTAIAAITKDDWASVFNSLIASQKYDFTVDKVNIIASILDPTGVEKGKSSFLYALPTDEDAQLWKPIKMWLTKKGVKVQIDQRKVLELDFPQERQASDGIIPTLGRNDQSAYGFIRPTFELFMSESRIWQFDNRDSFQDGLYGPPFKPFKRHNPEIFISSLVESTPLRNNVQSDLQFVDAPKSLKFELDTPLIPDVYSEKIYIWKENNTVYDIDIVGEVRLRDAEFLKVQEGNYSSMYLLPLDDTKQNQNFGKIVLKKEDNGLPMILSKNFFSSGSSSLGLNNRSYKEEPYKSIIESVDQTDVIITSDTSKSDEKTETENMENIDITKSFIIPIGNMQEGWALDTADENFLILPTEPRMIMATSALIVAAKAEKKAIAAAVASVAAKEVASIATAEAAIATAEAAIATAEAAIATTAASIAAAEAIATTAATTAAEAAEAVAIATSSAAEAAEASAIATSSASIAAAAASTTFECFRLGSKTASDLLLKQIVGIKSLYLRETQTDVKESKTYLETSMKNKMSLPDMNSSIDFSGPNGLYYREIFFEIPLHLATTLNSAGDYQSAQEWMHYVFNPQKDNSWIYRPFRELLERPAIASRVSDSAAIAALQKDLLDPHAIADTRIVAHMKAFMFRYIDNLLDWGDSLFAQDTRESINESLILYLRCLAILGERPYSIPGNTEFELKIRSAREILCPTNKEDNFTRAFFLPGWKNRPVVRKYACLSKNRPVVRKDACLSKNRPVVRKDACLSNIYTDEVSLENPAVLGQFFQVPENKQILTYWDRLDDRLDKIRRSLNISGIFRQLPLFQPPIDPRALIAAGGASGALIPLPVPHYRYSYLLDNAKELIEMTMSFGAQFQTALETGSAEELAMQELKISLTLNVVNQRIKNNEISVAELELDRLLLSQRIVANKLDRVLAKLQEVSNFEADKFRALRDLLGVNRITNIASIALAITGPPIGELGGLLVGRPLRKVLRAIEPGKEAEPNAVNTSGFSEAIAISKKAEAKALRKFQGEQTTSITTMVVQGGAAISTVVAGSLRAVPEAEVGTCGPLPSASATAGGTMAADVLDHVTTALQIGDDFAQAAQAITSAGIEEEMRRASTNLDKLDIENDLKLIDTQIKAAEYSLDTAKAEYDLVLKEEELLNETKAFLRSKFTNIELYGWLSRKLKALLKVSYGHALSAAKMAERALQYELPTDDSFISPSNWSTEKNGLLAAEMLMSDLNQMSLFHLKNDSRFQEIERKISLRKEIFKVEDGNSFADELAIMTLTFSLDEKLFDMDYPGHYFRIIKTVSLSIRTGSQNIDKTLTLPRLTLTQTGNKVLTQPNIGAVESLLGDESGDEEVDPNVLRIDWRSLQMTTISRWEEDNGMFNTNWISDDRYFPFEGTGAVSSWTLELGANEWNAENQVDMREILEDPESDIVMTVKYTANMDSGKFRRAVETKLTELSTQN